MNQSSTYLTLQQIADILSFKPNEVELAEYLSSHPIHWDGIVMVASQHLMLPALYCRLKAKNLLSYIPPDLEAYLEELTAINRNRNEELLTEAREVSELFDRAQIEHVFIKGIALIGGNTFHDRGERMIGDIDILIKPHQSQDAFDLLEYHGYTEKVSFNYELRDYRHLPRQINPNKMGAIELHIDLLIHKYSALIDKNALFQRKSRIHGISVPSSEDAIKIAILTTQINDHAHVLGYLKLKSTYDCLALGLQDTHDLLHELSHEKHSQSFLEMSSLFFPELTPSQTSPTSHRLKSYYLFKITHPTIGRVLQQTVALVHATSLRLKLFIGNKSYRMHILKNKLGLK